MLGEQCKFKQGFSIRQASLTSGGVRIASGHWVGDEIGLHSDSDQGQEFEDRPSADLNTHLIRYQGGAATPRKEEVGFSNPHSPWRINCSPSDPQGRASLPAHLHLSQVSYIDKSISCLSLSLAEFLLHRDMKNLNLSESRHRVSDSNLKPWFQVPIWV